MSVMVISVAVWRPTHSAAAATAAPARRSVTRSRTRRRPAAVRASSSRSRSTQRSPWPTTRITHGSPAAAWTQTAEPTPWPHGAQTPPGAVALAAPGRGGFHHGSGSQPVEPSTDCHPDANSGNGTNTASSVRKRNSPR